MMHSQQGFTLIEMLLCIAIITAIAGLSLPFYQSFQSRNDLLSSSESVAEMLRRAESYSRGNNGDLTWGVNLQTGTATLFQGSSYATRTTSYDETISIPSPITLSYSGDILFSKFTGFPTAAATEVFTSNGSTRTVTINTKGMVND